MNARDIMMYPVSTVNEDCTLEDAARTMLAHNTGSTNSEGKLTGILTESGFAAQEKGIPSSLCRLPQVSGECLPKQSVESINAAARSQRVSEFMSRAVASVDVADNVEAVITKMQKTGFHRLPVAANGLPAGNSARHRLLRLMVANRGTQVSSAKGDRT